MWVMWFHFHFQNCTDSLFIHFNSHFHVDFPTFYFHFSFYPKLSSFCSLGEMEAGILVSFFTFTSSRCNISVFVCHMGWISFSSHLYPKLLSFCSRREMGDDFGFTFTFYFHLLSWFWFHFPPTFYFQFYPKLLSCCSPREMGVYDFIFLPPFFFFNSSQCNISVFALHVRWVVGALISFSSHLLFSISSQIAQFFNFTPKISVFAPRVRWAVGAVIMRSCWSE